MIARIWRGITPAEKADAYLEYLRDTGLRAYSTVSGCRSIKVLKRVQGEHCEIMLVSLWDSMDAVREFAGENPDRSVYYPEDDQYLLDMEPLVRHYEVVEGLLPNDVPGFDQDL
jgi:heme-degrading monooxygenase HmoA